VYFELFLAGLVQDCCAHLDSLCGWAGGTVGVVLSVWCPAVVLSAAVRR
jgi:hypothetical protein